MDRHTNAHLIPRDRQQIIRQVMDSDQSKAAALESTLVVSAGKVSGSYRRKGHLRQLGSAFPAQHYCRILLNARAMGSSVPFIVVYRFSYFPAHAKSAYTLLLRAVSPKGGNLQIPAMTNDTANVSACSRCGAQSMRQQDLAVRPGKGAWVMRRTGATHNRGR